MPTVDSMLAVGGDALVSDSTWAPLAAVKKKRTPL